MQREVKSWLKIDFAQFISILAVVAGSLWAIDNKIDTYSEKILSRVNTIDNRIIARVLINEKDVKDLARRINRLHEHSMRLKVPSTQYAIVDKD